MATVKSIISSADKACDGFEKVVASVETKMFREAITLMQSLEFDAQGNIKTTMENLKKLSSIKAKLNRVAEDPVYKAAVTQFVKAFATIQKEQNAYFSQEFPGKTLGENAKKRHEAMKVIAVENTIEGLSTAGVKANVTDKLNDMLLKAVTTGASFADLQEEVRKYLVGQDGGTGALTRYATTYSVTSLSQFTGQNNKLLTDDLGVEWFMYVGSTMERTREFCQHMTAKKWVHVSEIPEILKGHIEYEGEVHKCKIYAKTKLPSGMIEGTNEDNFQVNVGGWNCRHQLVPVAAAAVPEELRKKFEKVKEPVKPEPIPEEVYKADLDKLEAYLTQHKSGKVADNVEGIKAAAANGDKALLDKLIAEANATIEKNEASIKSKKLANEKAKAKSAVAILVQKYGSYKWFDEAKAQSLLMSGTVEELNNFVESVNDDLDIISDYKNIKNPLLTSQTMTIEDMELLDGTIGNVQSMIGSFFKDAATKKKYIQTQLDKINAGGAKAEIKAAFGEWASDEISKLAEEETAEITKKLVADLKKYSEAHPKSGKIAQKLKEAEEAVAVGDFSAAQNKVNEANKIIAINEGSVASKKKSKAAAKDAAKTLSTFKWIKPTADDLDNFTPEQLKAADNSVEIKMQGWGGMNASLQYLKKKLEFEIQFVETSKKYATWKLVQNAYKDELKKVNHQSSLSYSAINTINSLKAFVGTHSGTVVNKLYDEIQGALAELKSEPELQILLDKAKKEQEEILKSEKAYQNVIYVYKLLLNSLPGKTYNTTELKEKLAAVKSEIDEKKPVDSIEKKLRDIEDELKKNDEIAVVSKELSELYTGHISAIIDDDKRSEFDKQYSELLKDVQSGRINKSNITKFKKEVIGWHSQEIRANAPKFVYDDENYTQDRKDAASWISNGSVSDSIKKYKPQADAVFETATEDEKRAQYDYTDGSGFMNRPLRGYDRGWGWSNFKGAGNVDLNNERSTGDKEITDLTNLIDRSVYSFDIWIQRGIEPSYYPAKRTEALESFLDLKDKLSGGQVRTPEDDALVMGCVGKVVTDYAFGSHGAAKGTGFNGDIINVYCPAGTKMLYVQERSAYNHNNENEMIMQRQTSYRITKVTKKGTGFYYIDCEVVAQI